MLFGLLILWIVVIFYSSSELPNVSHRQSNRVVTIIKSKDVFNITNTVLYTKLESGVRGLWLMNSYRTINAVVRKRAHVGIYLVLGVICSSFAYLYSKKLLMSFLLGVSLPVTIAVLDEFNQGFVGRTSSLNDVIIDGFGALIGTLGGLTIIILIRIIKR